MARLRTSIPIIGVLSTLLSQSTNVAASPVPDGGLGIDLGLGLDLGLDLGLLGGLLDFCIAPLVVEVIPYVTVTLTVIESAGLHFIEAGGHQEAVNFDKQTTLVSTEAGTRTTSSLCSTETTITSSWSSNGGKPTTATCRWSPHPPHNCVGSHTPTFSSTRPCQTSTTTTTASPCTTTTPVTTVTTTVTTTATVTNSACPTAALSCDKYGYLIQHATLYRVDLSTGTETTVNANVGDGSNANAIAYNTLDNYLYAYQAAGTKLLRIFSDGSSEVVTEAASLGSVNIGDIDLNGRYWVSSGGASWWQLDLYPGSSTYGKVINSGTADHFGLHVDDWVYLPNEGQYLWSVAHNNTSGGTTLIRFSMTTHTWEQVTNYPNVKSDVWGAQYGMNNGTIYASDNASGEIWQFPIGGTPFKMSGGPTSGDNDGARCVLNLL
ncbi:hypothetical protein F5884DRAFT_512945 [Xylogone sp. PMI_703]|nr:hypothetical protein F5884DRAFT_512945 [Xylogone sp. PMI_703]